MMDPATMTVKIKEIIGTITGISPESIKDTDTFVDDLGLDSLAVLEIVVDVEKAFKVSIPEEELKAVRSIQDTVNLILQHACAQVA
jgi:acyl carrier protein